MLTVRCTCGEKLDLSGSALGQPAPCPRCGAVLRPVAAGGEIDAHDFERRLNIVAGPARVGEVFLLGGTAPIEIGKLPIKPIHLDGLKVSRVHARLVRDGTRWNLQDLASTNGLFVNGERVTTHRLRDGDRVEIGEFTLEYHASADAEMLPTEALEPLDEGRDLAAMRNTISATDAEDYDLSVSAEELKDPAPRAPERLAAPAATAAAALAKAKALPPRQVEDVNPDAQRWSQEEQTAQRWLRIAKWTWPLLIILPILAYIFWPEPRFICSAGATVRHPPKQKTIYRGTPWQHNGATITPIAEYEVEGVVLSKAAYDDALVSLSRWDIGLGWGTLSDPKVTPTVSFQHMERGYRFGFTQPPPDTPWDSVLQQLANISLIPATDAIAKQIEEIPVGKTIELKGKLVGAILANGMMWQSGAGKASAFSGGESRVMWVEQVTVK